MARFFLKSILLVLFFAGISTGAETVLAPEFIAVVSSLNRLEEVRDFFGFNDETMAGLFNEIPMEAIDRDAPFSFISVTEGEHHWFLLALAPKDFSVERFASRFKDRKSLFVQWFEKNSLETDERFSKWRIRNRPKLLKKNDLLYVLPSSFPEERFEEVKAEEHWAALRREYDCAFRCKGEEPEYTVTGIRETEEGDFLCEFVSLAAEDSERAKELTRWQENQSPFQVGGFCSETNSFSGALRWFPFHEFYRDAFLSVNLGVYYAPPEHRDESNHCYGFLLRPEIASKENDREEPFWNARREGNVRLAALAMDENTPQEEGTTPIRELNRINEELRDRLAECVRHLSECAQSFDKEAPLDTAWSMENDVLYLALAFPTGGKTFDWKHLEKIIPVINEATKKTAGVSEDWEPLESDTLFQYEIDRINLHDGTMEISGALFADRGKNVGVPFIVRHEKDFFTLAVSLESFFADPENPVSTDTATFAQEHFPVLRQKIERSKELKDAGMSVPATLFSWKHEDGHLRLESTTEGNRCRYSFTFTRDAGPIVAQALQMFRFGK